MNIEYNYICPVEWFPNCRTCDSGYYNQVKFFKTEKELLDYALKSMQDHEIMGIYNPMGKKMGKLIYEKGHHKITGLIFISKNKQIRTVDDDNGKLIWEK